MLPPLLLGLFVFQVLVFIAGSSSNPSIQAGLQEAIAGDEGVLGDCPFEDSSGCRGDGLGLLQRQVAGATAGSRRQSSRGSGEVSLQVQPEQKVAAQATAMPAAGAEKPAAEKAEERAADAKLALVQKDGRLIASSFNSANFPQYFGGPLHCEVLATAEEQKSWRKVLATQKPNLKMWCSNALGDLNGGRPPSYANNVIKECLVNKDLKASADGVYQEQAQHSMLEADASYCFIAGHCSAEPAANNATLEDGVRMCDEAYGRKAWTTEFGLSAMTMSRWVKHGDLTEKTGYHAAGPAHAFAKLACATGIFHCDRAYCHEKYCHSEYYKKRYGCYAQKAPQHGRICSDA